MSSAPAAPAAAPAPQSPTDMLKSRGYLVLLVFGAIVGVPVAVVAYYFLKLASEGQQYFFTTLPSELGFHGAPAWWPLPMLGLCRLLFLSSDAIDLISVVIVAVVVAWVAAARLSRWLPQSPPAPTPAETPAAPVSTG